MNAMPLWALAAVFVGAGAVVWVAGISLSNQTDVLATRWGLGSAIGGVVFLAIATNLPEIAIVASASLAGRVEVAVGNILGGIAIQTVVLVALDVYAARGRRPLTYRAASLVLVLAALVVVTVLALVIVGTQLPDDLMALRITPDGILIVLAWLGGLLLVWRAGRSLPWQEAGQPPDGQEQPKGHSIAKAASESADRGVTTARSVTIFVIAAAATLAAGVVLERSGDAIADRIGLSGVLFGATILAAATSLPELSTGLASMRNRDYQLAVSDILGGNAFLPVLFLIATLLSGQSVLPHAGRVDIYLTALAMVLTLVYAVGLLMRPGRRILGMGPDSLIVLVLYLLGVAGLFAIAGTG